ncbi:MAG TPA: NAD-dependent epimerase/dehydratase family protein [Steroidobacteraceae bacterium]|nr:NAD-dependent epimerase/dehydratase family protein [Steroidobacteraceae bacterium]
MTTRRELLGWTAAGMGVLATRLARAEDIVPANKPLDILFLGGTGFIGPYQVEHALARGHRVTLFNRGHSTVAFDGKTELLVGNRDSKLDPGLSALKGDRKWDVVIDNSGYLPRHVRDSVKLLKDRCRRYVYISSVAVYDPAATSVTEATPLRPLPDPKNEQMSWERYGPLKAECDRIVQAALGKQATIVRPTYIVGPRDDTDRFTYWVDRVTRGGDVLAPPTRQNELQWIDARDLCPWVITLAEQDKTGIFNVAGPGYTWEETLVGLSMLSTEMVKFRWSTVELLKQLDIELPLVTPGRPSRHFDNKASLEADLTYRPLPDTAAAILKWWREQPDERRAHPDGWPTQEKERAAIQQLLAASS